MSLDAGIEIVMLANEIQISQHTFVHSLIGFRPPRFILQQLEGL
jgi:hypothetical protein